MKENNEGMIAKKLKTHLNFQGKKDDKWWRSLIKLMQQSLQMWHKYMAHSLTKTPRSLAISQPFMTQK